MPDASQPRPRSKTNEFPKLSGLFIGTSHDIQVIEDTGLAYICQLKYEKSWPDNAKGVYEIEVIKHIVQEDGLIPGDIFANQKIRKTKIS